MRIFSSVLIILVAAEFTTIPILYSKFTPDSILSSLFSNYNCSEIKSQKCTVDSAVKYVLYQVDSALDVEALISYEDFDFAFDGTFSLSMTSIISNYAKSYEFIHLIYGYDPGTSQDFAYYSESSFISIRDSALLFVKSFGWQKVAVLLSQEFEGLSFQVNNEVDIAFQCIVPPLISYDAILLIFMNQIKPLGIKVIIIASNEGTAVLIQKAIVEADMNKANYAFIFINHSVWTASLEGSILISDEQYIPSSEDDYLEYLIDSVTELLTSSTSISEVQGAFSVYAMNNYMKNETEGNPTLYVYNIQNSDRVLCGYINGNNMHLELPFIFPGNSAIIPDNTKIKLPISAYGAASNPDGTLYIENALALTGSMYAVYDINNRNEILSNFELSILNISDCGASIFDYDYCYSCLKAHSKDIGYFHLTSLQTSITQGTIQIFRSLNLSTPLIGIQTTTSMSNLIYYPQYIRVSYPNTMTVSFLVILLNSNGIKKISLLCTNTTWGTDFRAQFESQSEQYGIEILNKKRLVPLGFNGTDISFIEEIIKLRTRYLVMEVTSPDVLRVIEAFYDLGARRGDLYLFLGDLIIDVSDLDENRIGHKAYIKRKELMDGLIYFSILTYYGSIGERLKNDLLSAYGMAPDIMCLYYDAAYLGAYTLNALMLQGANLNSSTISEAIRLIKFNGCTGKIQIDKHGNDRSTIGFGI